MSAARTEPDVSNAILLHPQPHHKAPTLPTPHIPSLVPLTPQNRALTPKVRQGPGCAPCFIHPHKFQCVLHTAARHEIPGLGLNELRPSRLLSPCEPNLWGRSFSDESELKAQEPGWARVVTAVDPAWMEVSNHQGEPNPSDKVVSKSPHSQHPTAPPAGN